MIALSDALRDARLGLLIEHIESGTLTLYTEPQPETGAAVTTQTALVVLDLPADISITDHTAAFGMSTQTILATGLAAWGRINNNADAFVLDGDCGIVSSDALFRLKTLALEAGEPIATLTASLSE